MSRTSPRSDLFRSLVSSAVSLGASLVAVMVISSTTDIDLSDPINALVVVYVSMWPVYTAMYVAWGILVYRRMSTAELRWVSAREQRSETSRLTRSVRGGSSASASLSAAMMAVLVTVLIAVQPEFRGDVFFGALGLLTVAGSWAVLVFSFAQSYLHLALSTNAPAEQPSSAESAGGPPLNDHAHLRLSVPGPPQFGDLLTLSVLISTMAATTSAEFISRRAWRLVRWHVLIAFVFNSVVVAMMVSLLFGGLLS